MQCTILRNVLVLNVLLALTYLIKINLKKLEKFTTLYKMVMFVIGFWIFVKWFCVVKEGIQNYKNRKIMCERNGF